MTHSKIRISMTPAIQRLPTEILSEIFLYCSTKQDGCRPRLVATVCSWWRQVALSTSKLWCNIHLCQEEIEEESLNSLLKLQLERSGQGSLSVLFWEDRDAPSILALLLSVSHRWESLDLDILNPSQHAQLRAASSSHFPILKRLTIRVVPSFDLGHLSRPLPMLEELTLSWLQCAVLRALPWTRLTKCTIFHCSSAEVSHVLRSAPAIADLALHNCYFRTSDSDAPDPEPDKRTTSAIRSLKIARCSWTFNQDFLGRLALPQLHTLALADFHDSAALSALLSGSAAPITRLSLSSVCLSDRELIAVLHLADAITHLDISWPWDVHSNAVMEALTLVPPTRTRPRLRLLPHLRVLSIRRAVVPQRAPARDAAEPVPRPRARRAVLCGAQRSSLTARSTC
ncbi:hypothetical protein DFH06DRAFT_1380368 [Mycena polygramma]|nr:hypothetical protein DFH06DRAFT_1380368 [Mycena polygramma]